MIHAIDSQNQPMYSCSKCGTIFAHSMTDCPLCRFTATSVAVITAPYGDSVNPRFIGVRGSCEFCVCTSPLHTINGKQYCKACFDKRFTLIEKPIEGMGSA
jgi:hypothetical protein